MQSRSTVEHAPGLCQLKQAIMESILFVDMLGARAHWQRGGVDASILRLNEFDRIVIRAAKPDAGGILSGGIETDSAAFICKSADVAMRIVHRLYTHAFNADSDDPSKRMWFRGAVVPAGNGELRTERQASGSMAGVRIVKYAREFFEAVSIEKSGFKGMRLLVSRDIIDADLKGGMRLTWRGSFLVPFKRMKFSCYPKGPADHLQDYLWMIDSLEQPLWIDRVRQMSVRLRSAAADPEEFVQAAATQVLFHEADALVRSVWSQAERRERKKAHRKTADVDGPRTRNKPTL